MLEQKQPYYQSINKFASKKIHNAIQQLGRNLPCTVKSVEGSIVTVNFELTNIPFTLPEVQMPVVGFEYIRYPIKVGDRGYTVSADASLAGLINLINNSVFISLNVYFFYHLSILINALFHSIYLQKYKLNVYNSALSLAQIQRIYAQQ